MSSINLCEREGCPSMMKGNAVGLVALVTSSEPDAERIQIEVCPGCVLDLVTLLRTKPTSDREGAYREPYQGPVEVKESEDDIADRFAAKVAQRIRALESGK